MSSGFTLHVTVIEARGLAKMDTFTLSDPYALLQLTSTNIVYKTKICKNTLEPKWGDSFAIKIPDLDGALHILVKDKDIKYDDPMARLILPLPSVPKGSELDSWYPLVPEKGVPVGGEIHLKVSILPTEKVV